MCDEKVSLDVATNLRHSVGTYNCFDPWRQLAAKTYHVTSLKLNNSAAVLPSRNNGGTME